MQYEQAQKHREDQVVFKYKTKLCKNWESSSCRFGNNCLFAHGEHELRAKATPANYRTRVCVNLLRDGYCNYGGRCFFIHPEQRCLAPASLKIYSRETPIFVDLEHR